MVAGWSQRERVDLAGERLGVAAELGVNAAAAFLIEENARVVAGAGVEPPPPAP